MGCVQSAGVDDEAKARKYISFRCIYAPEMCLKILCSLPGNDEIESQLKRDRMMAKNEIKMLLLGAGESGKVRRYALLHGQETHQDRCVL